VSIKTTASKLQQSANTHVITLKQTNIRSFALFITRTTLQTINTIVITLH